MTTERDTAADSIAKAVRTLFETGWFSDFKIKCQNEVFNVHKSLLRMRSTFFATALAENSGFREAKESVMELVDDDPRAVRSMLEYLYTGDFDTFVQAEDNISQGATEGTGGAGEAQTKKLLLSNIVRVAQLADKYLLPELAEVCSSKFSDCFPLFDRQFVKGRIPEKDGVEAIRLIFDVLSEENPIRKGFKEVIGRKQFREFTQLDEFKDFCREKGDIAHEILMALQEKFHDAEVVRQAQTSQLKLLTVQMRRASGALKATHWGMFVRSHPSKPLIKACRHCGQFNSGWRTISDMKDDPIETAADKMRCTGNNCGGTLEWNTNHKDSSIEDLDYTPTNLKAMAPWNAI